MRRFGSLCVSTPVSKDTTLTLSNLPYDFCDQCTAAGGARDHASLALTKTLALVCEIDLGRQIDVPAILELFQSFHLHSCSTILLLGPSIFFSQGLTCSNLKGLMLTAKQPEIRAPRSNLLKCVCVCPLLFPRTLL